MDLPLSGYMVKNTPGDTGKTMHVYRPGEKHPAFMVATVDEAMDLIAIDRAQPVQLNRCVGCVQEDCPCLPV